MSPILDLQRRHAELYRIRLGERRLSAKGRLIPAALGDCLRLTSPNPEVIEAIASVYGGTVEPWEDQSQVKIPVIELRIFVLPGDSLVQWWEQWRKREGGMPVCTHRCNGEINVQTGLHCSCPPVEDRLADREKWCQPRTRLSVMLADVPVVGAGVLVTAGRIAAETLPQSVAVLQTLLSQGEMVSATLRVVQVESSGKSFVVPRLEIVGEHTPAELLGGERLAPSNAGVGPGLPAPALSLTEPPTTSEPPGPSGGEGSAPPRTPPSPRRSTAEAMVYEKFGESAGPMIERAGKPFTVAKARQLIEAAG